jgi:hypothetical protein
MQGIPLAPWMEIAYVVKDARNWEVDPARTASEFDAGYYSGLLEKAWGEAAFVFEWPRPGTQKIYFLAPLKLYLE